MGYNPERGDYGWQRADQISVIDFGATGDGTTNDSKAIQTAINSAALTGAVVEIPPGTYIIGTKLTMNKPIHLRGSGWKTILKAKNSLNDHLIEFTGASQAMFGAVISDLKLDGNQANQSSGDIIYAFGAIQCQFERVWFEKPYANALRLHQDGGGGFGHHNRITSCTFTNGSTSAGDGRAIYFDSNDENFVHACDFETNGRFAASEPNHIYDKCGLQTITNCAFVNGATGVKFESIYSKAVGCTFDGTKNHSIRINGDKNIVSGCTIQDPGNNGEVANIDGLWIDNVAFNCVTGCMFNTNGATRSGVNFANGATNNLCVGNIFGGTYTTGARIPGSGNTIANNLN